MKSILTAPWCLVWTGLLSSNPILAQPLDRPPEPSSFGRFGLSYRGAFNVTANFKNPGGVLTQSDPGPASGGGVNRTYDDGFNRVDSSGNAGGLTSFWGYREATQVPGNGTIEMNSSGVLAAATSTEVGGSPKPGLALTYSYPIRPEGTWHWGLETAVGFSDLTFRTSQSAPGTVVRVSDTYALNGIVPPVPPYSGPYSGPGPLIGDSPTRTITTIAGASQVTSQGSLDALLYELQLGPYVELPLWKRLSFSLGGGAVFAYLNSTFEFTDSALVPSVGTLSSSGRDAQAGFLFGGYVSGQLLLALSERFSFAVGAQYQHLGQFSQSIGGQEVELDLRKSVFLTAGITFTF